MSDVESNVDEDQGAVIRTLPLDVLHKALLQAFFARRALADNDGEQMYKRVYRAVNDEDPPRGSGYADACQEINDAISGLGLAIKAGLDQWTGKAWRALVNMTSDPIGEKATDYNVAEIGFYKHLIKRIIKAPENAFSIELRDAIKSHADRSMEPKIKKVDAQRYIATFVNRGWLHKSQKPALSLSVRAALELETYLQREYPEQMEGASCQACKELVFIGSKCAGDDCTNRWHTNCFDRLKRDRTDCPTCSERLQDALPVGEAALTGLNVDGGESQDDELEGATQSQAPRSSRGKGKGKAAAKRRRDEDEDEEEIDELASEESVQATQQKRRKGRQRDTSDDD